MHPVGFCSQGIDVWVRGAHDIATESQVTVQASSVVHSGFSSKNRFK